MPGSHKVLVLIKIATLIAAGWLISGPALAEKAQPPAASGPAPAELPAALFEQLIRSAPPTAVPLASAQFGTQGRVLMTLLALASLAGGVIVCRYWAGRAEIADTTDAMFLLFGLFSAIAAVSLATAVTGNPRMHVAAVLCTTVSGFGIGGFLLPQFNWTAQLLRPAPDHQKDQTDPTESEEKP